MTEPHRTTAVRRLALAVAMLLVALNLRPVFSSLAALLPEIVRDTGASRLEAGLLTTLPVACLGLFSPLAPGLAERLGAERALLLSILVVAAGTALRMVGTVPALMAGGAVAAAAIAIGNVLLPSLVKRDFADHAALMTGCFSMAMCGGAAAGAGLTIPVMGATGGWASALGAWAVPALATAALWLPTTLGAGRQAPAERLAGAPSLWRDALAWRVTLFMGLQSALAYCVFGWMATILRNRGLGAAEAGIWTSLSIMIQVAASLATPWLASRAGDQRRTCYGLLAMAVVGLLGAVYAPRWLVPPAVLLQGCGQGGLFAVSMLMIVLRSPNAAVAARLSGMAQGVGYVLAAAGPLLLGLLRTPDGGFEHSWPLFVTLGILAVWAASGAGQNRTIGTGQPR